MNEKLVKKISLENGFDLKIWDKSRILAGDRWLVAFEAVMDVPVQEEFIRDVEDKEAILSRLRKEYGDIVQYNYKWQRHFISEEEKDKFFRDFMNSIRNVIIPYLSRQGIGGKILISKYRDLNSTTVWKFH